MLSPDLAVLALFGLLAGVLAGFFGIGGGILFTPLLFTLYGDRGLDNPVAWAVGSSLFCTFVAALSSSVQQYRAGNLHPADGLRVGLFGVAGVWLGKQVTLSSFYTEGIFVTFFAFLLAIVSVLFYIKPTTDDSPMASKAGRASTSSATLPEPDSPWKGMLRLPQTLLTGGVGGFLAALAGIGGGVAMVPILNLAFGVRMYRAVSVSSLAIVLISLSGWLQFAFEDVPGERTGPALEYQIRLDPDEGAQPDTGDAIHLASTTALSELTQTPAIVEQAAQGSGWTLGYIDFRTVLPLAVGTWIGGFFGVTLNRRIPEEVAAIGYALLTMTVAIVMVLRVM